MKPKGPEDYRRLAEKCRETARTVLAEKERADLLAMAQTWDLIASRVGRVRWWTRVQFCSVRCEGIYRVKQNEVAAGIDRWHAFLARSNFRS